MSTTHLPRTLAAFAGLAPIPAHPSRAVLLLIDAQREYTTGKVPLAGMDAAVAEATLAALVDRFSVAIQHTAALSRYAFEAV
ncbi:MAG TPA: hypothetical protein VFP37_05875 [Steroidobacteraceae bacterium]|nr:hypothetical protein [Steroidobacteraceae bacterium]